MKVWVLSYFDLNRHGFVGYLSHRLYGGDLQGEVTRIRDALQLVKSPIEADLLAWLCAQQHFRVCTFEETKKRGIWEGYHGLIIPQCAHGPYTVDFLIVIGLPDGGIRMLIVECDGHEFHERTKAQAARDKRRDRYFAANTIGVMRFTGSEIFRAPERCALEVLDATKKIHQESQLNG